MLHHIIEGYGLMGIFLTLVLETGLFMFFLPGDTLIFAAGIFVENGTLSLSTTFSVIFVASVFGGHVGYFVGKKMGLEKMRHNKFFSIDAAHVEKSQEFFKKYGPAAIIVSRFVPIVRTFISPTLGILHYNKYKFALYNLLASLLWASSLLWLGITVGKFFPNLVRYTEYVVLSALLVFLIPVVIKVIVRNVKP
jgi:membrane-associated protein